MKYYKIFKLFNLNQLKIWYYLYRVNSLGLLLNGHKMSSFNSIFIFKEFKNTFEI